MVADCYRVNISFSAGQELAAQDPRGWSMGAGVVHVVRHSERESPRMTDVKYPGGISDPRSARANSVGPPARRFLPAAKAERLSAKLRELEDPFICPVDNVQQKGVSAKGNPWHVLSGVRSGSGNLTLR